MCVYVPAYVYVCVLMLPLWLTRVYVRACACVYVCVCVYVYVRCSNRLVGPIPDGILPAKLTFLDLSGYVPCAVWCRVSVYML